MPKSNAGRQAQWRARQTMRSEFFEITNASRLAELAASDKLCDTPEEQAVRAFFRTHPRCRRMPIAVGLDHCCTSDATSVYLRLFVLIDEHSANREIEAAAAKVALSEISSLPIAVEGNIGDGASGAFGTDEHVGFVRHEVAEMRRLGMWGAK